MLIIRSLARALALALFATAAHAAPPPPPAQLFFDNPGISAAQLSPDGKLLAVRFGARGRRDGLAVVNVESGDMKGVASFGDVDIDDFRWVNEERLLYDTIDRRVARGHVEHAPGLYAINHDGSNFQQLVKRDEANEWGAVKLENSRIKARPNLLSWNHFMLGQTGPQNSEFIYVVNPVYDGAGTLQAMDLKKVHTVNGRSEIVARPAHVHSWMLDHRGEPRLATALEGEITTVYYRAPDTGAWRKLASFNSFTGGPDAFEPLGFGPDGTLYVVTSAGKDKQAVHVFDIATAKIAAEPLLLTADFDFSGHLIASDSKLLGIGFTTDAASAAWFDEKMKAIQKEVDTLLPSTVNLLSVGVRSKTPFVLVESFSDVAPSSYMLFNTDTKVFRRVGSSQPGIDPATVGRQQLVRYKARDGLTIPAWLTLPPNTSGKNLPMVVLVHGGPFMRGGAWGWNPETQFLASRGYAVLEPEFRGSTGYGKAHFRAGWKQWGLAMQNDVADGASWAIGQGIADSKRICIGGASYGGYSAMMGLVNDPGLYQCGINWIGVTDIKLLYEGKWNFIDDLSERYRKYGMPELIGDQVKLAEQFKATSPLQQAAKITQPVLLAYGGKDRRVPLFHGEKLRDALKPHNKDVEWLLYPNETHGWFLPATRIDFWTRVESFLARNIGKP